MKSSSLRNQSSRPDIGVYKCELHLKFTLIEGKGVLKDRDRLLEILIDALSCGTDEYLETQETHVRVDEIPETEASVSMRRQIIRLRNSDKFA